MNNKKNILILGIVLFGVWWFGKPIADLSHRGERVEQLQQEVTDLESQRNNLLEELYYYSTDEFVETEARNQLNMSREGEKILILTKNRENGEVTTQAKEDNLYYPVYQQWLDLVFK